MFFHILPLSLSKWYWELNEWQPYIVLARWPHCPLMNFFFCKLCFNSGFPHSLLSQPISTLVSSISCEICRCRGRNYQSCDLFDKWLPPSSLSHTNWATTQSRHMFYHTHCVTTFLHLSCLHLMCQTWLILVISGLPSLWSFDPGKYVLMLKSLSSYHEIYMDSRNLISLMLLHLFSLLSPFSRIYIFVCLLIA